MNARSMAGCLLGLMLALAPAGFLLAALFARRWQDAETILKQLIAANPDAGQWEFYQALGAAQAGLKK